MESTGPRTAIVPQSRLIADRAFQHDVRRKKSMTEIILVRHGQSANNAQAEHLRVPDPGLTEIGSQQAAALAARLASQRVTHLYCSPFLRSLETVRPVAAVTQLTVRVRNDLFELGGCYSGHEEGKQRSEPGMGRAQLLADYPFWEIDERITDSGWWGGDYETLEQGTQRAARVERWLATEIAAIPGKHVLIIHADFKRLLLEAMQSETPLVGRNVYLDEVPLYNTGVTHCKYSSRGWKIGDCNCTRHLLGEFVTY